MHSHMLIFLVWRGSVDAALRIIYGGFARRRLRGLGQQMMLVINLLRDHAQMGKLSFLSVLERIIPLLVEGLCNQVAFSDKRGAPQYAIKYNNLEEGQNWRR